MLFPDRFLVPIAFQQTNRPVPVVYSLNTEFQLCNNEKVFMMDPATTDVSMAEMDYKGAFSMGTTGEEQPLSSLNRLKLAKNQISPNSCFESFLKAHFILFGLHFKMGMFDPNIVLILLIYRFFCSAVLLLFLIFLCGV